MAEKNWWESSPLVEGNGSAEENWWESSPLVDEPKAAPTRSAVPTWR